MLAFELVVLAAWTGVSPLQPVLFERPTNQLDGAIRQLTHCAVSGPAGTAFLSIEAAFKGALLLFGCLMAFSTRKVSASFNESQTIAWAIYNVVFSSLVVGAILLFLDTQGDTLVWLVLILFLWTAAGTWALIFVPKASAVFGGDEKNNFTANSISLGSLSKNDGSITFASITGLGRAQLLAYRSALEAQLDRVRRALGLAVVQADSEGKVLRPRPVRTSELAEPNVSAGSAPIASGRGWTRPRAIVAADESTSDGRTSPQAAASAPVSPAVGPPSAAATPTGATRSLALGQAANGQSAKKIAAAAMATAVGASFKGPAAHPAPTRRESGSLTAGSDSPVEPTEFEGALLSAGWTVMGASTSQSAATPPPVESPARVAVSLAVRPSSRAPVPAQGIYAFSATDAE